MGDSGIAGLWLRLALVLIVAMLVGVGSVLLANRTLPKPVAEGHNSTLSPFLTCVASCTALCWDSPSSSPGGTSPPLRLTSHTRHPLLQRCTGRPF
jgi:hypothetical protein